LAPFAIATAPAAAAPRSAALEVDAPAFVFSASSLEVVVRQREALAGRRLTVLAFVDGSLIGSYKTDGKSSKIVLDGLALEPGSHALLIKSGTFETRARFRFVKPLVPAIAAAAVALVLGFVVVALSRRRRAARRTDA
jgi:hypothetical protein